MAAISCKTGGVSSFNRISFGVTSDICLFSLTVFGIKSTIVVVLVVVVFGTKSTGSAVVVGASVVAISAVVDGASFDVGGWFGLVMLANCFVLFCGRSCSSDCHFLFSGC